MVIAERRPGGPPARLHAIRREHVGRVPTPLAGYGCEFVTLARRPWESGAKRVIDLVGSAVLLVALSPLLVLIAVAVRVDSGGPVFYKQRRVGRDLRTFRLWKFRSMRVGAHDDRPPPDRGHPGFPLCKVVDDPRTTRVGRVLRRWSLDELPQLWNVLRGDMSLVGPRPPLPEEVAADALRQTFRLRVRPGATGPWQVSGRSELAYADGVALDIAYVRDWSIGADLAILARTPWAILTGKGAH